MENQKTDLSIIIVNYNGLKIIENCILSITKYLKENWPESKLDYEIIVADNGSTDGSAEQLKNIAAAVKENKTRVILLGKNLGFAAASNIAAESSNGRHILFLNPDTEFIEGGFKKLIDFYDEKSMQDRAGAVGAKLLNLDMSLQNSCRSFLTLARQLYESFFLSRLFKKSRVFGSYFMTFFDHNNIREVDWLSGAFILFSRDVFFNVKGFDSDYFMYSEDSDICLRLKRAGYKNYYFPFYRVKHADAGIASSNPSLRDLQVWKSRRLYFKKNYSAAHAVTFSFLYTLHTVIRIFLFYMIFMLRGIKNGSGAKIRAQDHKKTLRMYFLKSGGKDK